MKAAAILIPPVVVAGIVAVLLGPHLVHGLDHGQQRLTVEELAGGARPTTRNLTVAGRAAMEAYLTEDMRKTEGGENRSTGVSLYVPIVPEGWTPTQPVHVILKTHYYGLPELTASRAHDGLARDVWWEGLDGKVRAYFTDQMHLAIAPDVLLLDGESGGVPFGLCLAAVGAAFGITLLLAWRAQRRSRPAR